MKINITDKENPWSFSFGLIFIYALVLYAQQAWVPGFFHDGYLYAALSQNAAELGHWLVPFQSETHYTKFSEHPPLYIMIQGVFFKIFGSGFTQARLLMSLVAIGVLALMYCFVKHFRNKEEAFFSCLILLLTLPFMKKVRFPNLDIALVLFSTATYLYYYLALNEKKLKYFFIAGLFWGLALLTKGLAAVPVIFSIFVYLLVSKRHKELLSPGTWFSLMAGLMIFCLWPLALKLTGNFHIFTEYFQKQFVNTAINGRGADQSSLMIYLKPLFAYCFCWLLLSYLGLKKNKLFKNDFFIFILCWFLGNLFFLSFVSFKYSHYILPIYPALAILAASSTTLINKSARVQLSNISKGLFVVVSLVLLIFPVTNKSSRSKELFRASEILEVNNLKNDRWYLVDDAVDHWGVANYLSFVHRTGLHRISKKEMLSNPDQKGVYLVSSSKPEDERLFHSVKVNTSFFVLIPRRQ